MPTQQKDLSRALTTPRARALAAAAGGSTTRTREAFWPRQGQQLRETLFLSYKERGGSSRIWNYGHGNNRIIEFKEGGQSHQLLS